MSKLNNELRNFWENHKTLNGTTYSIKDTKNIKRIESVLHSTNLKYKQNIEEWKNLYNEGKNQGDSLWGITRDEYSLYCKLKKSPTAIMYEFIDPYLLKQLSVYHDERAKIKCCPRSELPLLINDIINLPDNKSELKELYHKRLECKIPQTPLNQKWVDKYFKNRLRASRLGKLQRICYAIMIDFVKNTIKRSWDDCDEELFDLNINERLYTYLMHKRDFKLISEPKSKRVPLNIT